MEEVRRKVVGFLQDEVGEWVADLSCLHRQHVRHRPPFQERAWVLNEAERAARIGSEMECPLCDRAELPPELQVNRTAGPFDADSLPRDGS
jgi:tellurite methyltransferase